MIQLIRADGLTFDDGQGGLTVSAGVDSADGNLSKQREGEARTLCERVGGRANEEKAPVGQENRAADFLEQSGRRVQLTGNEKVQASLHPTGAEGEDRIAMTRGEPALTPKETIEAAFKLRLDAANQIGWFGAS